MALGFGHAVTKFCGNDARVGNTRFYSPVRVLCTAPAWGTVTDTIISVPSRAPLSGVLVTLTNGYAGATNANGVYSILVPAGTYTATAADPDRNCTTASPASANIVVTSGGTVTQDFSMSGDSNLESNGFTINDSSGNHNGVINSNECVNLDLALKNNGCAVERNISATLTTTTSVVTVTQGSSNYPNLAIDASGVNATPFQIQTSNSFECGTSIEFNLNLTYTGGSHSQCQRAPVAPMASFRRVRLQPLISRRLTGSDATVSRVLAPAKVALAVGLLGPSTIRPTSSQIMVPRLRASRSRSTLRLRAKATSRAPHTSTATIPPTCARIISVIAE